MTYRLYGATGNWQLATGNRQLGVGVVVKLMIAGGGTGGHTWSIVGGVLPPGTTLLTGAGLPAGIPPNAAVVSGQPTTPGTYPLRLRVDDSAGRFGIRETVFVVNSIRSPGPAAPQLNLGASLPAGRIGDLFDQQLVCINGAAPCSYSVHGGTFLPSGIAMSTSGRLSRNLLKEWSSAGGAARSEGSTLLRLVATGTVRTRPRSAS